MEVKDKMFRDFKVILIGGSPMIGKTPLALKLASKYEYGCISIDDINEIISTVSDINPMKDLDEETLVEKAIEILTTG